MIRNEDEAKCIPWTIEEEVSLDRAKKKATTSSASSTFNNEKPLARRRVFPSSLDGQHITGKNVEELIKSKSFSKLDDDDAVSLCCMGILQLVLLGVEDRRADANVKRCLPLYAIEPTNKVDKKSYSIFGFTWAFKGRVITKRLIPDEIEAESGWWVSSRAYFEGRVSKAERRPSYTPSPNWQPPISSHPGDTGLCDLNKLERPRREHRPSVYMQSPYTPLPLTTELPKKQVGKTKKKYKNDNLSPLNLGNAFAYDKAGGVTL
nr:hypothetical protein [Tanacetum cinerariifolium]